MESYAREIALFVHVAAAAVLIGTSMITPLISRRIRFASNRSVLATWTDSLSLVTKANPAFAVALLATGVYLGLDGWWRQGWFAVSVVAWVLSSVLAGGVAKPALERIARAASVGDTSIDPALDELRSSRAWMMAENTILASDLSILWIMISKPDLPYSAATLFIAAAVFAAFAFLPSRRPSTS